jgi:hypothetical protein
MGSAFTCCFDEKKADYYSEGPDSAYGDRDDDHLNDLKLRVAGGGAGSRKNDESTFVLDKKKPKSLLQERDGEVDDLEQSAVSDKYLTKTT